MLGSLTHIDEAGGGPTIWNGLFGDAGLLTDLWTPQGIDSFAYDADGAMTSLGDFELEFDQWNNLTAVHDKSINQDYIESYLYDFANRLVGVISSDGYIDLWVHDGQRRAERWRASNSGSIGSAYLMDEYIFGHHPHQLLAATTNESQGGILFPLSDERHSIIGIWFEGKAAFAEYAQYDPDGRVRIRNSEDHINCSEREMQKAPCSFKYLPHFGFTGAFRSTTTGLTHLGARWYSARLGQFISPDPLWYIDSFDLYAYAGFDPINKWDPSGLASRGLASTEHDRWGLGTSGGAELLDQSNRFAELSELSRHISQRPRSIFDLDGVLLACTHCEQDLIETDQPHFDYWHQRNQRELERRAAANNASAPGVSLLLDTVPGIGEVKSLGETISGHDLVTGERTSRVWASVGIIPILGRAKIFRHLRRFHLDEAGSIGRRATRILPSNDILKAVEEIRSGASRPNVRSPRPFNNDGRGGGEILPRLTADGDLIRYVEHTVNPRPPGGRLDAKRIVTGNDGSMYWTDDHYKTFHKL